MPFIVAKSSQNPGSSLFLYSDIHNLEEMQILLDRLTLTGVKSVCDSTLSVSVVTAQTPSASLAGGSLR